MTNRPSYEELADQLLNLQEAMAALRSEQVDAIVGDHNVFLLRLKETEEELRRHRDHLDALVQQRTEELHLTNEELKHELEHRRQVEAKLEAANRELHQLTQRLLEVQELERQAIARELHDETGQSLTYLRLLIDRACRLAGGESAPILAEAKSVLGRLMQDVRDLSFNLRPSMLEDLGLLPAIRSQADRYTTETGIQVQLEQGQWTDDLPVEVALAVYRIIQEALTNVARHAKASRISICLDNRDNMIDLAVTDDGVGFIPDLAKHNFGLRGMSERASILSGSLKIDSAPGRGTTIRASIPIHRCEARIE